MGRKKSEKHWFICKRCNEYIKRKSHAQLYCTPCSYKASKEKGYTPLIKEKRVCENCKLNYEPNNKVQKFCSDHCRIENKTKEANKAWMTKVEKPRKRQDSNKVAYSFFKIKKYEGWTNRFKVCRG